MKNSLIDFHNKCLKLGCMPNDGLCGSIPDEYKGTLELFKPEEERTDEGYNKYGNYWGSDIPYDEHDACNSEHEKLRYGGYGILRQTIVEFILAMHGEL